jgi:Protein of unknown function (DUF3168)
MSLVTVEEQLRTALLADGNIAPIVGTRLYVEPLPQQLQNFPAITMTRIATVRNWVRSRTGQFADMGWVRLQLDIWDNTDNLTYQRVSQLIQYIIQALRTFNAYGNTQAGSNRVLNQQVRPTPELQPPGYRGILDLKIWFSDNT